MSTSTPNENDQRFGLLMGMSAYIMWGFFPFFFKQVDHVNALEILAHRIIWATPFAALVLIFRKQLGEVIAAFRQRKIIGLLLLSSAFISVNWGLYTYAIVESRIFEASLGYYINPLVFVLLGVVINKERLSLLQIIAVGFAAIGVVILTIYGGVFPWISLVLALSFAMYGLIRQKVVIGSMAGLLIEALILLIPCVTIWFWFIQQGNSSFTFDDPPTMGMLIFAGPLTVIPLFCFALAARRLPLSTIGFLQFIAPTLQFLLGLYYGESFTMGYAICFGFIWLAVVIYAIDRVRSSRPNLHSK